MSTNVNIRDQIFSKYFKSFRSKINQYDAFFWISLSDSQKKSLVFKYIQQKSLKDFKFSRFIEYSKKKYKIHKNVKRNNIIEDILKNKIKNENILR